LRRIQTVGGLSNQPDGDFMSFAQLKTNRRREKLFGAGRPRPMDRNMKARIMVRARSLMRRTEKHKHYGQVTAKFYAVLEALLWGFHNQHNGLCFPSYDRIAARAGCARSTVALAIKALESAQILTWVHRLVRKRDRVLRTSNGYRFYDAPDQIVLAPKREKTVGNVVSIDFSTKSEIKPRTAIQDSFSFSEKEPPSALELALNRLADCMKGKK
jgi:hypothetical protein